MTLQQLRDFLAVVTHGGYRAAARSLGVAQAGLTKSIAKLEEAHGVVLIDRSLAGATLSAQGVEFHRLAAAVVLEADRAEAWLQAAPGAAGRRATSIALGASIEPSLQIVPAVLADFQQSSPGVTLQLTQATPAAIVNGLRENRLEIAVTRVPPDAEGAADLVIQPLFESESIVAVRTGHPLATAPQPLSIAELASLPWLVLGDPAVPGAADASMLELFAARGLPTPRVAAVTDSLFDALATLQRSDLLARLPASVLQHPLVQGRLAPLRLEQSASPRYTVAVVHKATRVLSAEARRLAAMLVSWARSGGAAGPVR
jgi:LysR family transcriptional regulator of abg operon